MSDDIYRKRGMRIPSRRQVSRRAKTRERGAVMVETALTLLLLILLILAGMDLGQVLFQLQSFGERARETARWASTHTTDTTSIKNYGAFGTATAPTGATTGRFGLSPGDITVSTPGAGTTAHRIDVSITKPLRLFTPFLSGTFTPRPARATVPVESAGASPTI
jgi:Flp pilus assembly protein TadG